MKMDEVIAQVMRQHQSRRQKRSEGRYTCLLCMSNRCAHIDRPTRLTPREREVLQALINPRVLDLANIAHNMGIASGTLKVYLSQIYRKLGNAGANLRLATLWAMTHAEELHLTRPTGADFPAIHNGLLPPSEIPAPVDLETAA